MLRLEVLFCVDYIDKHTNMDIDNTDTNNVATSDFIRVHNQQNIFDVLHKKRDADAKHDLKPTQNTNNNGEIRTIDVKETYPSPSYEWGVYSNGNGVRDEDQLLSEFVYENLDTRTIKGDISDYYNFSTVTYLHDTVYDRNNKDEKMKSKFYRGNPADPVDISSRESLIQAKLEEFGVKGNIFLFVDTAKAKLKKDLTYAYGDTVFFWVDSRAQKYDAAGSTNPDTEIGKKMCGWNKDENKNFRYCWEYVQPGLTTGYLFNKYDTTKSPKLPQECVFSKYDIQLIATTTNAYDPNELEGKLVMTYNDNGKDKYIYSDKTLSNKSGTNVSMYNSAAQTISKFLSVLVTPNTTISNWTNSSLVISKYCGDTLQLLLAMIAATIGFFVLFEVKTNDIITGFENSDNGGFKKIKTNKNSVFVTNDRIAAETAIYILGMIVIFDRGSTCDIFVPKSYQDPYIQFFDTFPDNEEYYNIVYRDYLEQSNDFIEKKGLLNEELIKLKEHILVLSNINIDTDNDKDEKYRYVIALWKLLLQISPMYSNIRNMELSNSQELPPIEYASFNEKIQIISNLNRDDDASKSTLLEITNELNNILNPYKVITKKLKSFNKAQAELSSLLLLTNIDLTNFLTTGTNSLKNRKVWDYKIKSDILYDATPISNSQRSSTRLSRIANLFSSESQYCSIFAMGEIMFICNCLKGPFGNEVIDGTDQTIKNLFYNQIDGLINNLKTTSSRVNNSNFIQLIDQFKNKFNELKTQDSYQNGGAGGAGGAGESDVDSDVESDYGNTTQESDYDSDNNNSKKRKKPTTVYKLPTILETELGEANNTVLIVQEDNDISNFTKILKIELLLKIFCLIKKNIIFIQYDDNNWGLEEKKEYASFDNNDDDDDKVDDVTQMLYYIKNDKNEELINNGNIIEYLKYVIKKEKSEEKMIIEDVDNDNDKMEVVTIDADDDNVEIISFNDIESIIDMDSTSMNNPDNVFDLLFKNIMNQIFLSRKKEITISVNEDFYKLFEKVCAEITSDKDQPTEKKRAFGGGNIKHNILKKNTHKYIEKTNKKTKRRKNKKISNKVSKKKLIKSNSKTRKYRQKRLS
jgi:hypothetical protein